MEFEIEWYNDVSNHIYAWSNFQTNGMIAMINRLPSTIRNSKSIKAVKTVSSHLLNDFKMTESFQKWAAVRHL